jgi:ABC-type phosphate transport system substrate-binding protein
MSKLKWMVPWPAGGVLLVAAVAACGGSPSKPEPQPAPAPIRAPRTAPAAAAGNRAAAASTPVARQAIAIVVNPQTKVNDVTFAELRRLFLGEQQFWKDHSKVTLLVRAPTARERSVVLEKIYRMDEEKFHEYWIGKMFRAEVAGGPKIVYSTDMALNLIAGIKGSITFIPASAVTSDVKVLKIDGLLPSDAAYPLR